MFNRRQDLEEIVTEETKVWNCSSEDCKCWIRDNFKSNEVPTCPMCQSEMIADTKLLQVVNNPFHTK